MGCFFFLVKITVVPYPSSIFNLLENLAVAEGVMVSSKHLDSARLGVADLDLFQGGFPYLSHFPHTPCFM